MSERNAHIYESVCEAAAKNVTKSYSTSFSGSIRFFSPHIRQDIYNIYGFVRFADEIVDTFHTQDKKKLLDDFIAEYRLSDQRGHSMNPIIHAFIKTKRKYNIPDHLPDAFLESMEMDLGNINNLDVPTYHKYIYGSAEVVGLMCLLIFVGGDREKYEKLVPSAKAFGAALQKINFLRDISADFHQLNRTYFPEVDFENFSAHEKSLIEKDIESDLKTALEGIKSLPKSSIVAVYLAYRYYSKLFSEIKKTNHSKLFQTRIRVSDYEKSLLLMKVYLRGSLNLF